MRVVSGIGAIVFGWLALIPFSLIASTFDSACTGPGCETPLPLEVLLVALYCLTLLVLGGAALVFADHAVRGRPEALARQPLALRACAAVVGVTLFVLFCATTPIGGAVATLIAIASVDRS